MVTSEAVISKSQLPPPPPPPVNQMGDGEDGGFYQYGDPHLVHPNEWGVMQQQPQGQHMLPMNPVFNPEYQKANQQLAGGYMGSHHPIPQGNLSRTTLYYCIIVLIYVNML